MNEELLNAMQHAVSNGDIEVAESVVLDDPRILQHVTRTGRTWMYLAAEKGRADMIRWLAARGLDPDVKKNDGFFPLWAAFYMAPGDSFEPVSALLQVGADPNAEYEGDTVLLGVAHWVDLRSNPLAMPFGRLLLEYGADPNAADREGRTSLHIVVKRGHRDLALLMLEHGADPEIKVSFENMNAFQLAERYNHPEIAADMRAWTQAHSAHKAIQAVDIVDKLKPLI